MYWAKHGVDWKLVTEDEINQQKARNIEWLFQASGLPETFGNLEIFEECLSCFEDIYFHTDYSILMVAKEVERRCQLDAGMGIRVFQYLVQSKQIAFYIDQEKHYWSEWEEQLKALISAYETIRKTGDTDIRITVGWICTVAGLRESEIKGRLHRFPDIRAFV